MQAGCTASNWAKSFKVPQALHSLPMARQSLFSEVANSCNEAGPRIESDATPGGVGTLRWWMRVLLSLGSLLGEGN
jgi:hypothetical protein